MFSWHLLGCRLGAFRSDRPHASPSLEAGDTLRASTFPSMPGSLTARFHSLTKCSFSKASRKLFLLFQYVWLRQCCGGRGGGRSGGSTERPREGGREKKKTNNNIWAHFNRLDLRRAVKPLIQIARVWVVSSARLTCSGRPASFQSEKDRAGRRARSRCDRCVRARARVWSWGINGADFYPLAHTPRRLHACMRAPPVLKLYGILRRAVQQWKLPPEELRGTRECPFVAQFGKCDFYPCPTN